MNNETKPDQKKSGKKLPINLFSDRKIQGSSGFIIVRLAANVPNPGEDLRKFPNFAAILNQHEGIVNRRLIRSVKPERLLEMEKKAAKSEFPPLHSLTSYWRIDCRKLETKGTLELLKKVQQLPEVDHAYLEQMVIEPLVDPSNDALAVGQDYLEAAETGIDAIWAWEQGDGEGAGVGFIDLEQGWFLGHEDLIAKTPTLIFNDINNTLEESRDHGTAVLGEVVGADNSVGIVGVAPGVTSVRVVSHYEAATLSSNVADAITAAIDAMAPGDVLLLEVQGTGFFPAEIDAAVWATIRLASALGVIVIEPAGNGNKTLDTWSEGGRRLDRTDPLNDSGAIMVGSCDVEVPHNRYTGLGQGSGSNFGARVDCFALGEGIVTTGYGLPGDPADVNHRYTNSFGGTSGASAIIAGAALILQGKYQATAPAGGRLSPKQMRALLSDPATGTAQSRAVPGRIGVMPNLRAIIRDRLGLTPDVYLRDAVGDTGVVPSSGSISASPDIIVRPARVDDPDSEFLGSGRDDSNSLGSSVEFGQDNYIYVRMRNRNTVDATNTTATVYWSEPATLVTPDRWNLIGTTPAINVPAGDRLVVAGPITWPSADIPATGHYCFVGILNQASDPEPLVPPPTDWDGFRAFIRNNNNVTWRNFNVIDDVLDPSIQAFMMTGAPDRSRLFDVEIIRRLPESVNVVLEVPLALFANLPHLSFLTVEIDHTERIARLNLPHLSSLVLENVNLRRGAQYPCRLILTGLNEQRTSGHSVAIRQIFEEQEVGRITWAFEEHEGDPN